MSDWDEIKRRQSAQNKRDADERVQRSLDAAAAEEAILGRFNAAEDMEFVEAFKDVLGYTPDEIQRYVTRARDADVGRLLGDIDKAGKAGNTGKVKRLLRKNKAAIKSAAKEGKSQGSGCAVIALVLLGSVLVVIATAVHGAAELAGLW